MADHRPSLTLIIGHPELGSPTRSASVRVADLLLQALGGNAGRPELVDLAELAPFLLSKYAGGRRRTDPGDAALAAASDTTLMLISSPVIHGACSGLLKVFFDLLPRDGLAGTVAVPLMTVPGRAQLGLVDSCLRWMLLELGATVPAPGIGVLERDADCPDEVFRTWWAGHAHALTSALGAAPAGQRDAVPSC
jgi:FMN reductase